MRWFISICFCLAFAGCGLDETTHRSDKPLTLEAAQKDDWISSMPFPTSATNIYYFYHAGGMQEYENVIRFTVDSNDLNLAISNLCVDYDKTRKEHHTFISTPIATAPHSPLSFNEFGITSWWIPDLITNGYYCGDTNGQPFDIWVDVPKHTIYLSETD
jgi:hypothetical protein